MRRREEQAGLSPNFLPFPPREGWRLVCLRHYYVSAGLGSCARRNCPAFRQQGRRDLGRRPGGLLFLLELRLVTFFAGRRSGFLAVFGDGLLHDIGGAADGDHIGLELREQVDQNHLDGGGDGHGQQRAADAEQRAAGHQGDQGQKRVQVDAAADDARGDDVVENDLVDEDHHQRQ